MDQLVPNADHIRTMSPATTALPARHYSGATTRVGLTTATCKHNFLTMFCMVQ
jgi:hypothetical protein